MKYILVLGTYKEFEHWVSLMKEEHPEAIYKLTMRILVTNDTTYYFVATGMGEGHVKQSIMGQEFHDVIYLNGELDWQTREYVESRMRLRHQ